MGLASYLVDKATSKVLLVLDTVYGKVLATRDPAKNGGVFKAQKYTALTTGAKIVGPDGDGSIELTDLIVAFEKAVSEVTIRFTDGTNTETVWFMDLQDSPVSLAMNFAGNWQGWQSAYLEVVITANLDGAIAVGYVKHKKEHSLDYTQWDARR